MQVDFDQMVSLFKVLLELREGAPATSTYDNGMVGQYVVVRCRDAGVHAGRLESHHGRECVLTNARRLWYWKPADGAAFLSGVAECGLHGDSKVGRAQNRLHLTETCEISRCSEDAARSIISQKNHNE